MVGQPEDTSAQADRDGLEEAEDEAGLKVGQLVHVEQSANGEASHNSMPLEVVGLRNTKYVGHRAWRVCSRGWLISWMMPPSANEVRWGAPLSAFGPLGIRA